jgi:hypothetical protein
VLIHTVANVLAYLAGAVVMKKKGCIMLTPGSNVVTLFTVIIYECP